MISKIEALNFRCLKYVSRPLTPFQVLVGPNASGKSTFFDVIAFIGDVVSNGPEFAVAQRVDKYEDLTWNKTGDDIELTIEACIPTEHQRALKTITYDLIRYDLKIGKANDNSIVILHERVILLQTDTKNGTQNNRTLFPELIEQPRTILYKHGTRGTKTIISKTTEGNDIYRRESTKGWQHTFVLGPKKSALGNLPEDESNWPASTWLKNILQEGIQNLVLNSAELRLASRPGKSHSFNSDGSNLPWVIYDLKKSHPRKYDDWIEHLKTALPDISGVEVVRREDDGFAYIVVHYQSGLKLPSWVVSDGTLRVLALSVLAYIPGFSGIMMIEEPENGIHPRAIEPVVNSLSSVYLAQILLATHSPVLLSSIDIQHLLCFAKDHDGATDIVLGSNHPKLRDWQEQVDLSILFAAGVLG